MTFRIQRAANNDVVVLTISGDIAAGHASELRALLDADLARPVLLDLKDLAVVDRVGVLVLAGCEARGRPWRTVSATSGNGSIGINSGPPRGGHHDPDRDTATQ